MNRLDRALGILLLLRSGATVSAAELARRFEVSARTIYRDIETLAAVGVPVYAELGRHGGFRLAEGYFLPPIMFTSGEATALLVGVAMLRRLRSTPFAADLEIAARKVVAALPEQMRTAITRAERAIGFEGIPPDLLHPERGEQAGAPQPGDDAAAVRAEGVVLGAFLQAIVEPALVQLRYHSPDEPTPAETVVAPRGLVWDRDRWYLVGVRPGRGEDARLWRADRVVVLERHAADGEASAFDVRTILGRRWLSSAMARWIVEAPVVLTVTPQQAERLQQDWYYRHARYEPLAGGRIAMTFGEDDPAVVFALLRWLGPGAQLASPTHWRQAWRDELRAMLAEAEEAGADTP